MHSPPENRNPVMHMLIHIAIYMTAARIACMRQSGCGCGCR